MSFRRVFFAIAFTFALAFSTNVASFTADACDPVSTSAGLC
jgi:hypothetical protein